jgi:SAM-dependent methyltransferase
VSDDTRRLSREALAQGDPTGWFEKLYAEAGAGTAEVPWDSRGPSRLLAEWVQAGAVTARGRTALVIGCGLGRDAEFLAGLGFTTTAFDISPTAVRTARERHPASAVEYGVADLLDPPPQWRGAFDLVLESNNVQALPKPVRDRAIAAVGPLVAPGGTLLVLAAASLGDAEPGCTESGGTEPGGTGNGGTESGGAESGTPPWPLTRAEINAFAAPGLTPVRVEMITDDQQIKRWLAEYRAAG